MSTCICTHVHIHVYNVHVRTEVFFVSFKFLNSLFTFSPDNQWFIETMNSIFEIGGNLVRREVAHNLMRLIAEGTMLSCDLYCIYMYIYIYIYLFIYLFIFMYLGTEDDEIDKELRNNAVLSYLELLDKPHLPDILIKIICWV